MTAPPPPTGLCAACAHQRLVRTGRGSEFSMCRLHFTDPDWPKYPRLPVLRCPRFSRGGVDQPPSSSEGSSSTM